MIRLVPKWAYHYDEFWQAISVRNLWFIRLRYFFIAGLILFLIGGEYVLTFALTPAQITAILVTGLIILLYNFLIQIIRKNIKSIPGKFNSLHLSLVQMILDLMALMILVYFTGIIESPLHLFFIFQLIIGSIILPGYLVYTIAAVIIIIYSTLIFMQYYGLAANHYIAGLYSNHIEHEFSFIILFIIVFAAMLIVSVYLANNIARRLYQREKQLVETFEKLKETEKAKQKYIIGVVHEVKSPISSVRSILDLVNNEYLGPVSEEAERKINRAKKRTDDAIQLINSVVRLSKLKLLDMTTAEEVSPRELLKNIIGKNSEEIKRRKIHLHFEDYRKDKKNLYGDKILLELALSNIFVNAMKYGQEGGKIEAIINDKNSNLVIDITDDGIGIPEKEINKIFNQFFRASNIVKDKQEGSGMGLSVVKEVIERHRGKIDVQSPSRLGDEKNPGTTVLIELPYKFAPQKTEDESKIKMPEDNLKI